MYKSVRRNGRDLILVSLSHAVYNHFLFVLFCLCFCLLCQGHRFARQNICKETDAESITMSLSFAVSLG